MINIEDNILNKLISHSPIIFFALDKDGIFTLLMGKGLEVLGLQQGEMIGQSVYELSDEIPLFVENVRLAYTGETFHATIDIDELVFDTTYIPLMNANGDIENVIGVGAEITELKRSEVTLKERADQLSTLLKVSNALLSTLDHEEVLLLIAKHLSNTLKTNGCALSKWDKDADAIVTWIDWRQDQIDPPVEKGITFHLKDYPMTRSVLEERELAFIHVEDPAADPNEVEYMKSVNISSLLMLPLIVGDHVYGLVELDCREERYFAKDEIDFCQAVIGQAAIAINNARLYEQAQQEIILRREIEDQLRHDAYHDALTGLPNRVLFKDRLQMAILRNIRNNEFMFGVLFIDIDNFKVINDSLGHNVGDFLLKEIAHRLECSLREVDTVARLGGDEFVILLEDINGKQGVETLANRVSEKLAVRCNLKGHDIRMTASIGVIMSDQGYEQPEDYLRDADLAMYHAKSNGKARFEIFTPELHKQAVNRLILEAGLQIAVENNELIVHYQPIFSLETNEIVGFEALIRWQHPELGLIPPNMFIPLAEETGLIIPIGNWIMEKACAQIKSWQETFPSIPPFSVNVNISSKQIMHKDFVSQVENILHKTRLNGASLCLEVTESTIVKDVELATSVLTQLIALGVSVHLDDFGTGYSALGYLRNFPVGVLKIDRSFIDKLNENEADLGLVKTIIIMARELGLEVIAEGIESPDQLTTLKSLGCDFGQGYLISKPKKSEEIELMFSS